MRWQGHGVNSQVNILPYACVLNCELMYAADSLSTEFHY